MSGVWLPQIVAMLNGQLGDNADPSSSYRSGSTTYVGLLDRAAVARHTQQGDRLFYIKGQEEYSVKTLGVNLVELGAKELVVQ